MRSDPRNGRRRPERRTPDLAEFPNLVVIYLGMKVKARGASRPLVSFGLDQAPFGCHTVFISINAVTS
jgi:hypothetical protein